MKKGRVIKSTGSFYDIQAEDGKIYKAKIRGKFRLKNLKTTNPVAVGDWVMFEIKPDGMAVIKEILPRKNHLLRKSTNLSKKYHILASNIDQVFVIYTPKYPETLLSFLDRILLSAEAYHIPVKLLINKMDLFKDDAEALDKIENFKRIYSKTGYPILEVSAKTGENLDKLKDWMKDQVSMFTGNSGVGKSSLINAVVPGLNIKTKPVSEVHAQGRHTTTFAQMYPLPFGGYIIDTPGVRAFGTVESQASEVRNYFPEIRRFQHACKFNDCMHINEPQCAVKQKVEEGEIPVERYRSYLDIVDEIRSGFSPYRQKKYDL